MVASASDFLPLYVSQINREVDGDLDDCALSSGIMLLDCWTLREGLTRPNGRVRDVINMREQRVRMLGPGKREGGLTLGDVDKFLRGFDPSLPPLPRYPHQENGGTLRLSFEEYWKQIQGDNASILLGNPSRVKNPNSPLRTKQLNDAYGHAVFVYRAERARARLLDPLTRKPEGWQGEWVSKEELYEFSTAYGTPGAVGCSVVPIGGETAAARLQRRHDDVIEKLNRRIDKMTERYNGSQAELSSTAADLFLCRGQVESLTLELQAAQERILELETTGDIEAARREGRESFRADVLALP